MYCKLYECLYGGSMVGAGLNVFAVWPWILSNTHFGVVEVNPKLLAFTLGGLKCKPEEIEDALDYLQRPDPESRSKLEEGRRLIKEGQFQYRVVNWEEYNRIRNEEERREYNRVKQREGRALKHDKKVARLKRVPKLPGENLALKAIAAGQDPPTGDQFIEPREGEGIAL